MTNVEKLFAFFECENKRDWHKYQTFLADDIQWELNCNHLELITGKEQYLKRIQQAYQNSNIQFICQYYQVNADQSQIVTVLCNDLGETSCDIFEFKDGLILRETEYILKKAD